MDPFIVRKNQEKEFYTDERCFIIESVNAPRDIMSIARARVEPGITTAWHLLDDIDERYLIISGRGKVEVGDNRPEIVGEGDVVFIPKGIRQRISNTGDSDLIFYCVCTPGFMPDKYHGMED